jgi:hypothetical protein
MRRDAMETQDAMEARIKGDMDRHAARGRMSMDDQMYLLNQGVPLHAPIPDEIAAGLPSRTAKGASVNPNLSEGERQYLSGK